MYIYLVSRNAVIHMERQLSSSLPGSRYIGGGGGGVRVPLMRTLGLTRACIVVMVNNLDGA